MNVIEQITAEMFKCEPINGKEYELLDVVQTINVLSKNDNKGWRDARVDPPEDGQTVLLICVYDNNIEHVKYEIAEFCKYESSCFGVTPSWYLDDGFGRRGLMSEFCMWMPLSEMPMDILLKNIKDEEEETKRRYEERVKNKEKIEYE